MDDEIPIDKLTIVLTGRWAETQTATIRIAPVIVAMLMENALRTTTAPTFQTHTQNANTIMGIKL